MAWGNSKEVVRLAQGRKDGSIAVMNTIFFKHLKEKLARRTAAYLRVVSAFWSQQEDHTAYNGQSVAIEYITLAQLTHT